MAEQSIVENPVTCGHCQAKLFVECVSTRDGSGFYSVRCPMCGEINRAVQLSGDPVGVRIPAVSFTRAQVEAGAKQFGTQRRARWQACGTHDKKLLPTVSDSDLRFCPRCLALWDGDRLLNEPGAPTV